MGGANERTQWEEPTRTHNGRSQWDPLRIAIHQCPSLPEIVSGDHFEELPGSLWLPLRSSDSGRLTHSAVRGRLLGELGVRVFPCTHWAACCVFPSASAGGPYQEYAKKQTTRD